VLAPEVETEYRGCENEKPDHVRLVSKEMNDRSLKPDGSENRFGKRGRKSQLPCRIASRRS
jgi:hypothetical protein